MSVDLSGITALTAQIAALQTTLAGTTDPAAKAVIQAQINVATAQLQASATHAQSQVDASNNFLTNMSLFSTLQTTVGSLAPSLLTLFKG